MPRTAQLIVAASVLPAAVCLLSPTAGWWFAGEIACHWGMHAAFALLPAVILWRQRRALAALVLCLMVIGCWPLLRAAWEPRAPLPAPDAQLIRIATANLNVYNRKDLRTPAINAVLAEQPDIFVLAESISSHDRALIPLDIYPHQIWQPQLQRKWHDCVALISKYPILRSAIHDLDSEPYIEATLDIDGRPLHVIAVHTQSPWSPDNWQRRNVQLAGIAVLVKDLAQRDPNPILMLGDWNLSVASPAWVNLRRTTQIQRVAQPEPATWRAELGPLGITIDHLFGRGLALGRQQAFTIPGSDHRGLSGTLVMEARSSPK
jgi:endonuclease/exonuclease/phosphatase (EEP) superfamily protein YafD